MFSLTVSREQEAVLRHEANLTAQRGGFDGGNIDAVDHHLAPIRGMQSGDQAAHRTLAGARRPHQSHHFAGPDAQARIAQDLRPLRGVGEGNAVKLHFPPDRGHRRARSAGLGLDREQRGQVAKGEARALQLEPIAGETHDRRRNAHRDEVERDQLTQGQGLRDHQVRAIPQQRGHHQLAKEVARLLGGVRDALGPVLGPGVDRELRIPATLLRGLDGQQLDGLDPMSVSASRPWLDWLRASRSRSAAF